MRQSILYHVYVQDCMLNKVITAAVIKQDLSEHFPIVLHLKASIHRYEEKHSEMRKIMPEKLEIFLQVTRGMSKRTRVTKKHEF